MLDFTAVNRDLFAWFQQSCSGIDRGSFPEDGVLGFRRRGSRQKLLAVFAKTWFPMFHDRSQNCPSLSKRREQRKLNERKLNEELGTKSCLVRCPVPFVLFMQNSMNISCERHTLSSCTHSVCVSSFLDLLEYRQSVHEENRRISHYPSSIGLFSYCCFLNLMIVESEVEGGVTESKGRSKEREGQSV